MQVHQKSEYAVPVSAAFAYVDNPATVHEWMFGVASFTPAAGSIERGLGAVYDVVFSVKPIKIKTTMKVIEYEEDRLIRFDTVKGFTTRSAWIFESTGPDTCTLEVDFEYELPGGLAGKAMGRALEPIVGIAIKESEKHLLQRITDLASG